MYRKLSVFVVLFLGLSSIGMANTIQDQRRVEEEKRQSLQRSETYFDEGGNEVSQPPRLDRNYFNHLLSKRFVTNEDVAYTLMVLLGVNDRYQGFEAQKKYIQDQEFLSPKLLERFEKTNIARRGSVAYLFYRALEIKGGLILRIFGPSQRYAIKELVYHGIMFSGNSQETISGDELVHVLSQSAEFLFEKMDDEK